MLIAITPKTGDNGGQNHSSGIIIVCDSSHSTNVYNSQFLVSPEPFPGKKPDFRVAASARPLRTGNGEAAGKPIAQGCSHQVRPEANRRSSDRSIIANSRSRADWYPKQEIDSYQPSSKKETGSYRRSPKKATESYRLSMGEREDSCRLSTARVPSAAVDLTTSHNSHRKNELSLKGVSIGMTDSTSNASNVQFDGMPTPSRSATRPQTPMSRPLSAVDNTQGFGLPLLFYQPLEKMMEKKAILLGMRQLFFQVLQKKRDLAKAEHGSCSKQYKHWLADSLTWTTLC